jgi:ATP-dependent Lon protease
VDAQGRKLTSDRPIRQCLDREQKILNPSGTVKGTLGPVLSPQERREQEARAKVENEERARLNEEKRRDRALLVRYPTPEAHQKERSEALAHVAQVKQSAALRVSQLQQDKAKLAEEMAFYQKDPAKAPPKLRRQIDEVNQALAAQDRFMAEQDSESQRINSRFDEEYQRLLALWRMKNP